VLTSFDFIKSSRVNGQRSCTPEPEKLTMQPLFEDTFGTELKKKAPLSKSSPPGGLYLASAL